MCQFCQADQVLDGLEESPAHQPGSDAQAFRDLERFLRPDGDIHRERYASMMATVTAMVAMAPAIQRAFLTTFNECPNLKIRLTAVRS